MLWEKTSIESIVFMHNAQTASAEVLQTLTEVHIGAD